MLGYIKSHSNYRIQERHQLVNNGAIFERDISTVGGANTFATGLATVYQSGNFVIVLNNSSSASRHIRKGGWLASGYNSDIWDEAVLSQHSSDIYGSLENRITPKNDFIDLRTFAYYGSLSSLVENTVSNILTTFPYELYISENNIISEVNIPMPSGTCYNVENPGNIDIYNTTSTEVTNNGLGHFYNGGMKNYSVYFDNNNDPVSGHQFTWDVKEISRYRLIVDSVNDIELGNKYIINGKEWAVCGVVISKENYVFVECFTPESEISESGTIGGVAYHNAEKQHNPCRGMFFAKIEISTNDSENIYEIYALWDRNLNVRYVLNVQDGDSVVPIHIRPRVDYWFYDEFIDNLDLFGKCLMGEFSHIRNTANFEVLNDFENGKNKTVETFVFPTTNSGYNLESSGIQMEKYIKKLGGIGIYYDENYTNNLYRMITHDSLKNLDWTSEFNGNDGDGDNIYVNTGKKFSSLIKVMGYVFDKEKSYIDTIGYSNTITYSDRNNLSDYFLTDSLETDGWTIASIYPYELTEYDTQNNNEEDVTNNTDIWCVNTQLSNRYSRKFREDTSLIISPYFGGPNAYYEYCSGSTPVKEAIANEDYTGQKYEVVDGNVLAVIKDFSEQYQLTLPDVNNEFMKRLRINSKQILRKKGTIDSIESILSLFGLKSKRWVDSQGDIASGKTGSIAIRLTNGTMAYVQTGGSIVLKSGESIDVKSLSYGVTLYLIKKINVGQETVFTSIASGKTELSYTNNTGFDYDVLAGTSKKEVTLIYKSRNVEYDFDVEEYTLFAPPIIDGFDDQYKMHKINWYNSCKTIPYQTQSYLNGEYVDYQGLPIAYRDVNDNNINTRKLYPYFSSNGLYDGDMYYQMNGGWMNYMPYRFDEDDRMFSAATRDEHGDYLEYDNYIETLRNVGFVNNIDELVSQKISDLTYGIIYYVTDISGEFALINGYLYPLKKTIINGSPEYYFETTVFDSSVSIGGELYTEVLSVSDPNGTIIGRFEDTVNEFNVATYNLNIYSDGYVIRIYYTGDRDNSFLIASSSGYTTNQEGVVDDELTIDVIDFENQPETSYLLSGGSYYENSEDFTHYFELGDVNYCDRIGNGYWRQINKDERICKVLDAIVDNYEGNNPHSGNYQYDNGKEYIRRFKQLFKYSYENELFNETCFPDVEEAYNDISGYGFTIYEDNDSPLISDVKIHAFIDKILKDGTLKEYDINDRSSIAECGYGFVSSISNADGVSSQVINTKNIKITFYVDKLYTKEGQEYIKYIQCKIMPYVEQMLPSTSIVEVEFVPMGDDVVCNDEEDDNDPNQSGVDSDSPESPESQSSSSPEYQSSPSPEYQSQSSPSPEYQSQSSPSPEYQSSPSPESQSLSSPGYQSSPSPEALPSLSPEAQSSPSPEAQSSPVSPLDDYSSPSPENNGG